MSTELTNQTLAIAGVFQSAIWVEALAKHGRLDDADMKIAMHCVLNTNPTSYADVFGGSHNLTSGLKAVRDAFNKSDNGISKGCLQYAMALIAVQLKLDKRDDLTSALAKGVDRAVDQHAYFNDALHTAVIGSVAQCYQDSASKLDFRIRVTGNPTHLQNPQVAEKIRALLLFGVRSALLWRQAGGRRWHFVIYRKRLQEEANRLLKMA